MEPITTEDYATQIKQMVEDFKRDRSDDGDGFRYGLYSWHGVEVLESPSKQGYVYLKIDDGYGPDVKIQQAFPGIDRFYMQRGKNGDSGIFWDENCTYVAVPCTHASVLQLNMMRRKMCIDEQAGYLKEDLAGVLTNLKHNKSIFSVVINAALSEYGLRVAGLTKDSPLSQDLEEAVHENHIDSFLHGKIMQLEDDLGEAAAKDAFVEVIKKALPAGMRVEKVKQVGG